MGPRKVLFYAFRSLHLMGCHPELVSGSRKTIPEVQRTGGFLMGKSRERKYMTMQEGRLNFENAFNRTGNFLREFCGTKAFSRNDYEIADLSIATPDSSFFLVKEVEDNIAPVFDDQQFASPGMQFLAETDTRLLQKWLGNIRGKRILDIGPGTGRVALPMAEAIGENGKISAIDISPSFLNLLAKKAALAQIPPGRLKLGTGDLQNMEMKDLLEFLDFKQQDVAIIWFSVFALMSQDPQEALTKCTSVLKPGGQLLINTNSYDGVAYRVPERAIKKGADPLSPLGYSPSIYISRAFSDPNSPKNPNGMVLRNGDCMPAIFYSPDALRNLLTSAGFEIVQMQGITRLAGLYPRDISKKSISRYAEITMGIEIDAGLQMAERINNPEEILDIAKEYDQVFAKDPAKLSEYNYIAVQAKKKGTQDAK